MRRKTPPPPTADQLRSEIDERRAQLRELEGRTIIVQFKVNRAEREKLNKMAAERGVKLSELIRQELALAS